MGIDPISIGSALAAAAKAAAGAAQTAVASIGSATGVSGGAGAVKAGSSASLLEAGGSKLALDAGIQQGIQQTALKATETAVAKATAGKAAGLIGQGALAATAAGAAKKALAGPEAKPADVKIEGPEASSRAAADAAERERRRPRSGRAANLLSSPLGVTGAANTGARSLVGSSSRTTLG